MVALRSLFLGFAVLIASPASADPVEQWRPFIAEGSLRFGIPEAWIVRVMRAESAGRASVAGRPIRSPKGAMGLMQLMPDTWSDMRRQLGLGGDPDDPRDNILAGSFYLRLMYDRFGYPGLFGAYNAGPARYAAWLSRRSPLPGETIAYMAAVSERDRATALPRPVPPALFAVRQDRPDAEKPAAPSLFAIRKGSE